jgi:ribosomal protein L11 methyltransferase
MKWVELSITVEPEAVDKTAAIMRGYGKGGTVIEKWEDESGKVNYSIKIYLLYNRHLSNIRHEISQALMTLDIPAQLTERHLEQDSWFESLKNNFKVMKIGRGIIIKPSWIQQSELPYDGIVIELDPGAAFGTGLHPTTRLCLINLERKIKPHACILDLGTGTGILSIAAAKLGASEVIGLDTDPVAVKAARSNAENNNVNTIVQIKRGTLSTRLQRENKDKFDIILANITARAISELANGLYKVLKTRGVLIASGIHSEGLDGTLISLAMANFKLKTVDQENGWYAVTATKAD